MCPEIRQLPTVRLPGAGHPAAAVSVSLGATAVEAETDGEYVEFAAQPGVEYLLTA